MRSNVALARTPLLLSSVLATALMTIPQTAGAQYVAPSAPPLFGVVRLSSGFMPDPHVVEGQGGGPVSLSAVDGRCRGYAQQAPSHVLMAASGFRYLAVMVNASFDTTLMVQTPDGQIYCNDDGDGLQARVELSTGPGPIRIWVGAYSSSGGGPYRLGFSEIPHLRRDSIGMPGTGVAVAPPPMGGPPPGIRPASPPLYGATAVRAGFMPDPQLLTGVAGGPLRAGDVDPSCRGYITPEPTHIVTAQTPFRSLRFVMSAELDTTLLIQYPDGRIVCDDDGGEGLNALIDAPTAPGPIRIWVGSYSSGRTGPYTMALTEYPHITASTLAGGSGPVVVTPTPGPVAPPPVAATRVDLMAGIPVTIFGPLTTATLAVWSPRGGPTVEIGVQPGRGGLDVTAGVGGRASSLITVPSEIARDAVVTVTQRRDGQLIVHAERPGSGAGDPGAQMMFLLAWPRRGGTAPEVAQLWLGAGGDRAPRWAR